MENWIDIKGYEGIYEVSDLGRIRTCKDKTTFTKRHGERKWTQKVLKYKGYTPKTGYRISLWKEGKSKDFLVSRLVAFNFFEENIENKELTVNHIDGNRMNNNLYNLELISLADNIRHAFENGLVPTCKSVELTKENETKTFYSMSKASVFLGKNKGFISSLVKKGEYNYEGYNINII